MNKNKGFTLIELLAVIVVLAVIAFIAAPMVLKVVDKAKREAMIQSGNGYIDAVEKELMLNEVEGIENKIGIYSVEELHVSIKGQEPKQGILEIEEESVKHAKLCMNNISLDYDGNEVTISSNNYCSDNFEVSLVIVDNEIKQELGKKRETTFDLNNIDMNTITHVSCNNGAIPKIEDDKLTITHIYGDTKCILNNTLENTIDHLDNSETNIVMIEDEEISNSLTIDANKNVILNLNDKNIITIGTGYFITLYGKLNILAQSGGISGTKSSFVTLGTSVLNIEGGIYNYSNFNDNSQSYILNAHFKCHNDKVDCYTFRTFKNAYVEMDHIYTYTSGKSFSTNDNSSLIIKNSNLNCISDNCIIANTTGTTDILNTAVNSYGYSLRSANVPGNINIKNSNLNSSNVYGIRVDKVNNLNIYNSNIYGLTNAIKFNDETSEGIINIYNSKVVGENSYATVNYSDTGIINIYSGIYISNHYKAIGNNALGTTNIMQTKDPIYIATYGDPNSHAINAISTNNGNIKITGLEADQCTNDSNDTKQGLCIYSTEYSVFNDGDCNINISGGTYIAGTTGIVNRGNSAINICNARLKAKSYDLEMNGSGMINYSNNILFTDETNTPNVSNSSGTINSNYVGICIR